MMNEVAWQLQVSLVTLLRNSPNIMNLLGSAAVFDEPPRRSDLPYVVVSVRNGTDWSTSTEEGAEFRALVRIWSDFHGRQQVLNIASAVEAEILSANLNLPDYHLINLRLQNAETGRESDGRTFLTVLNFRAVTEPI